MKSWAVCLLLFASWAQANDSAYVPEANKHIQAPIEAPALATTPKPLCLDSGSSDYHPSLCEHFCSREGTRFDTETNMQIKYLVRRTLTYKGVEDYYKDLFAGSRTTPSPSRSDLALLIDQKNSQVNARLRAYEESLAALEAQKTKYPNLIKAKTEKIDQLDTLAKTPHYDNGTLIRSGLNFEQRKEHAKLLSERSKLIKEQRDNEWAIERTPTHIALIRDQQAIVGVNPTEWKAHAEIKNAFTLQTQHGVVIFEFSEDTSNPEPEKIWLQSAGQTKKLLCDATDQYVMSEKQYRASPPSLGIEHFKDWKNSLQKKMDEAVDVAESIGEVAELHQKEQKAAAALKGADEVCAWIATRQPQSALDLRQLQMEYLKSIYNTLSSQKSTLKQKLETPRDLELEALQKVINTPINMGNWDATSLEETNATKAPERKSKRPHSTGLRPTVRKTKKPAKEESQQPYVPSYENDSGPSGTGSYNQQYGSTYPQAQYPGAGYGGGYPGYGANGSGGYPGFIGGGGGFYGGVNGGMTFDMKTSGDVAGILGKASEIFDYCVRQSLQDSKNELAVDMSYDLGLGTFIYQAASFFTSPYVQSDNTQLFFSLQPHNTSGSIAPLYQQQSPYNNFGPGFTNGYFKINSSW